MRAFFVPSSSNEESIKIQSSQDRYAHWKQRGSTKVLKAAGAAVKLATACAVQQRFSKQPVLRSSWQQLARFNKGSQSSQ